MKTETYQKQCDVARLTQEIKSAGYILYPTDGFSFYGCTVTTMPDLSYQTKVMFEDNLPQEDVDTISAIVEAHEPIPLPQYDQPTDEDHKPFVRAESRPLNCTTIFTTRGDFIGAGSIPPIIGGGDRMEWDASDSNQWTTDGCPQGWKRKVLNVQFCDSIWIKEGTVYYINAKKGSKVDMKIVCPHGGFYIYLGEVRQNLTGQDLIIEHYVNDLPIQGDVPMGDELNTETCSQEMPSYLKFQLEVTIPESDTDSYGYVLMEMYRNRTVVIE